MKIEKRPGSIRLKYSAGTGPDGKETFVIRTMNNIHPDAPDEAVYALRALLTAVQEAPATEFLRSEAKFMTEE